MYAKARTKVRWNKEPTAAIETTTTTAGKINNMNGGINSW